jgi:hypothetical protein
LNQNESPRKQPFTQKLCPAQSSPPRSGRIYSILFAVSSPSPSRFIQPVAAARKEMWGTAQPGTAATMCVMSQDVHTPRVIASHFVAGDARGYIQPSSERRQPETLQVYAYMAQTFPVQSFMDEVDGRPGAVALQSGHLDAPLDVPMVFLSHPHSTPQSTVIPSTQLPRLYSGADQPKAACPTAGGLHHRRWRRTP